MSSEIPLLAARVRVMLKIALLWWEISNAGLLLSRSSKTPPTKQMSSERFERWNRYNQGWYTSCGVHTATRSWSVHRIHWVPAAHGTVLGKSSGLSGRCVLEPFGLSLYDRPQGCQTILVDQTARELCLKNGFRGC